ncbi:DUF4232 domain-containing protein [Parasphingorhabdus pacifica]
MHDRKRTLRVLVGLCTASVMLAGCGDNQDTLGEMTERGSGAPEDESAMATACTAHDFNVEISLQPPRHDFGMLRLTNTSGKHCPVEGWTGLTVRSESELPEQVPFKQVPQPTPAKNFDLAPGDTAYSGVRFFPGDQREDNAYNVAEVVAIPPGTNESTSAKLTSSDEGPHPKLVISGIEMGTLQPSEEGITTW